MTKAESWSISIDRSCHIGPSRTSNCFDLNYPEDALSYISYIYILYNIYYIYIKIISKYQKMDNQTHFSIQ